MAGSGTEHREAAAGRTAPGAKALLRLARGFLCLFWGIPLTLLFFFRSVRVYAHDGLRLPPYVLGVLLMLYGTWILHAAGPITVSWRRRVRQTCGLLLLMLYFAPFVHWWQQAPYHPYLFINVLFLFCASMGLLMLCGRLAEEAAGLLDDRTFRLEAEIYGWSVILLLVVPFLVLFLLALHGALRHRTPLLFEMARLRHALAAAWMLVPLLPVSLIMNACWKAKTLCLQSLRTRAERSIS